MVSAELFRTWLFVPGHDERKMARCLHLETDTLVVDWEDSVLPAEKNKAREITKELSTAAGDERLFFVRVNGRHTPWREADMRALVVIRPGGIMIPKCESAEELRDAAQFIADLPGWDCQLCPLIESPHGLLQAVEFAEASERVSGLAFGAEDFCAATGIRRTLGEPEILFARSALVVAAKSRGLAAIDSPTLVLDDQEVVSRDARRASNLGFTGKLVIHPRHLPAVANAFAPSADEARQAEELLNRASAEPQGVFRWNGRMVDSPVLEQARQLLASFRAHTRERKP